METMNENQKICCLGKTELACMYMPYISSKSALATFNRWLRRNKALQKALADTALSPKARIYTPLQVRIIFDYLGEP